MDDNFLKVAKEAALEAGKVVLSFYHQESKLKMKGDISDFSTQADLEAEKIILKIIITNFPDHNIIAEEGGGNNKKIDYTWLIDPIDGTISFVAKIPYFAISIGLIKNNQLMIGVINQIATGQLYYGGGKATYLNGKKIKVSKAASLEMAVLGLDYGHAPHRRQKFQIFADPILDKIRYPYSLGGSAASLALVAEGRLDGFISEGYPWDFAGGAALIEAAGGKVTNLEGQPVDWTKQRVDIIASNGLIHDQILEALKK